MVYLAVFSSDFFLYLSPTCGNIITRILLVLTLTWFLLFFFPFAVLVPLTRSVYKPATTILSLQSEIETTRRIITVLQPTHRSALTVCLTWYEIQPSNAGNYSSVFAFRGTLDTFTQSEGGPVSSTDGKMNGWTRGCQDKEGVRGQTAASGHLSWETSTTRQQRERRESGQLLLLREDTLRNERLRSINCPTKSGFRHAEWTAAMNPRRDPSKDTIWFPVKAAVHCPVMSVITQNVFKLTNVSLPRNDHWLYEVPFYPTRH